MKRIIKLINIFIMTVLISLTINAQEIKKVAFTFDDGPRVKVTEEILDILKENNAKATFFVTGFNANRNKNTLKRISDEGHLIGNHSYDHPNFKKIEMSQIKQQLQKTQDIIYEVTGEKNIYFRPPYGAITSEQKKEIKENMKLTSILWDLSPQDWLKEINEEKIVEYLIKNTKDNSIILLHDTEKVKNAIKIAIPLLKENGFEFVSIEEIRKK